MQYAGEKICIVGGSVAGLGLCWALRARGLEATVFERSAHALKHRGAGVMLAPDIPPLLGLEALPVRRRLFMAADGRVLHDQPVTKQAAGWSEIYARLRELTRGADVRAGAAVEAVSAGRVRVGGAWESFDLVVGADGFGSVVRPCLDPDFLPHYLGYMAVRGMASFELPEGAMAQVLLSPEHVTLYTLPGGRVNWMWYRSTPLDEVPQDTHHVPGELEARLRAEATPGVLTRLLAATESLFVQPIYAGSARRMAAPGLALIGDAAHLAVPHAGAGVTLALHDAVSLAETLATGGDLEAWERIRQRESSSLLDLAVRIGAALQARDASPSQEWWAAVVGEARPYFES